MQSICTLTKEKGTDNNASCGSYLDNHCAFLHYCQVRRMTQTINKNILVPFLNLYLRLILAKVAESSKACI